MMAGVITAAIMALAPGKVADDAALYTSAIVNATESRDVDPLLVVAFIHVETGGRWESNLVSPSNDYGLMQTHVSRTTNREFVGREKDLLDPAINIEVGVTMLVYWKEYHAKHCKGAAHKWWAHYKWGVLVKNNKYSRKVYRVYSRLKRRVHLLCTIGAKHDHSCGRTGCLRKEHTDQNSGGTAATIQTNLISEIRWPVWASDQKAPNRTSGSFRERAITTDRYCTLGAVSRRRRRFPGLDDYGQV